MKRLTNRNETVKAVTKTFDFQFLIDKLAEYEDLEENGLLLRTPCKVGDIVIHENPYASVYTGIQTYQITKVMISQNKKGKWTKKYHAMLLVDGRIIDSQLNFTFDDIGKTIFPTKA